MLPRPPLQRAPPEHPPYGNGRIAQLVEQLTLNQRVLGSSPSASTIPLNHILRFLKSACEQLRPCRDRWRRSVLAVRSASPEAGSTIDVLRRLRISASI